MKYISQSIFSIPASYLDSLNSLTKGIFSSVTLVEASQYRWSLLKNSSSLLLQHGQN